MAKAYKNGDRKEYFRLNQQIHEAMAGAACNPMLDQMRQTLTGRIARARYYANISTPHLDQTMAEHDEILAALKARDGERLGRLLKEHLAHKLETLRAVGSEENEARK